VHSVCSIGGYGHVRDSLSRLLTPAVDAYPRIAVCLNLGVFEEAEADALRLWLWDDSVRAPEKRYPAARAGLGLEQGRRVDGVIDGTSAELPTWFQKLPDDVDQLDVSSVADRIRVPVVLIHGASDRVIPPSESIELGRILPNATVCVTSLLTHGDAVPAWKKPGQIGALGKAFARFLG
jgi:pimeloyl-ACP methyl ester carboxylesterase